MPTLLEIDTRIKEIDMQIASLRAQIRVIRQEERAKIANEILSVIAEYSITIEELGLQDAHKRIKRNHQSAQESAEFRYRNTAGQTWRGGPGRKPKWVVAILAEGRSIEEFAVKGYENG